MRTYSTSARSPLHSWSARRRTAGIAGWEQLLPEAVAGKGPGLSHQRADDVTVIDVGFPFTAHPLHAFHQVVLVLHFHPVGVQPDLHLLADEAGGNGIGPTGYLSLSKGSDGAPLVHPGLVVDVFRHGSWGQGPQASYFLLQLSLDQTIASLDYLPDEVGVVVDGVEIPAAPQDEGLVDGVLETIVTLLGDAVLVALAAIDAGGPEAVVVQQGFVGGVELSAATAAHLVGGGGGIVAAHHLGDPAQDPQGGLDTLLQSQEGLAGGDLVGVAPPEWLSISWNSKCG